MCIELGMQSLGGTVRTVVEGTVGIVHPSLKPENQMGCLLFNPPMHPEMNFLLGAVWIWTSLEVGE